MYGRNFVYGIAGWSAALFLGLSGAWAAQQYPFVVTFEPLSEIGIALPNYAGDFERAQHDLEAAKYLPCYNYGETSYRIEIRPSFLEQFVKRGFSRQSLCLGLISHSKYDPENGRRLPTYTVVKSQVLEGRKQMQRLLYEGGSPVSDEMPLDLPNCFRNANPYTDCQFRFGRLTGKKLTDEETNIYHRLGAAYDRFIPRFLSKAKSDEIVAGDDGFPSSGEFQAASDAACVGLPHCVDADVAQSEGRAIGEFLLRYSSANVWAKSYKFPRGYGYGLDAWGGAGEDDDPASVKAVSLALGKPKVTAEELRRILAERH